MYFEDNTRRQFSTGSKTKDKALKYCLDKFKNDTLTIPETHNAFVAPVYVVPNRKNSPSHSTTATENKCRTRITTQKQLQTFTNINNLDALPKYPLFKEYVKDWYVYDKCQYIQKRLMRGFHFTRSYADGKRRELERHILPYFKNFHIDEIDEKNVEEWIMKLKTKFELGNSTINNILKCLKLILSEGYKNGDIPKDVAKKISLLKNDSKSHGVFTDSEVSVLFDENALKKIWSDSLLHYGLNKLASKTGMRIGEIQALKKQNIHKDHILVAHTWVAKYGLKDTKTHKDRIVPISPEMYILLQDIALTQPKGDYIFSVDGGRSPISRTSVMKKLRISLRRIGVTNDVQKERNLSFHSYRHYVNTLLVTSGVPISVVQSIIGHVNDDKMTEHYTHVQLKDQMKVLEFV